MPKIKHTGMSLHRLKGNPIEAVFSREWYQQNTPVPGLCSGTLQLLLCSERDRDLTQAEATAAATAIQWLGSPVGFSWLRETLRLAGYEAVERKGAKRG